MQCYVLAVFSAHATTYEVHFALSNPSTSAIQKSEGSRSLAALMDVCAGTTVRLTVILTDYGVADDEADAKVPAWRVVHSAVLRPPCVLESAG
jgi:hypothetical protein